MSFDTGVLVSVNDPPVYYLTGKRKCVHCKTHLLDRAFFVNGTIKGHFVYSYFCYKCVKHRKNYGYELPSSPVCQVMGVICMESVPNNINVRVWLPSDIVLKDGRLNSFTAANSFNDSKLSCDVSEVKVIDNTKLSGTEDGSWLGVDGVKPVIGLSCSEVDLNEKSRLEFVEKKLLGVDE